LPPTSPKEFRVFLIGDSTVSSYASNVYPRMGWGQVIDRFLDDKVAVENRALSGRSTKSFIDEGRWEKVRASLAKGDYLFIQFGHNDMKSDRPDVYAPAATVYRENLTLFITEARKIGATPVLITPVSRRTFAQDGTFFNSLAEYQKAMIETGKKLEVPVIDLTTSSQKLVTELGPDPAKKLYLWYQPGEQANFPQGSKDDTHFCEAGAVEIGKLVAEGLRESHLPIVSYLKSL